MSLTVICYLILPMMDQTKTLKANIPKLTLTMWKLHDPWVETVDMHIEHAV